jgi:hypothetical protein
MYKNSSSMQKPQSLSSTHSVSNLYSYNKSGNSGNNNLSSMQK